ncbi:MAG: hypothetical protein D6679_03940 [Candidatus Hydrogenedentota bacterium]|nr:MAG: hypothetical protein D6679_03940 [Candidatus Hydrogenedentota bacterium]
MEQLLLDREIVETLFKKLGRTYPPDSVIFLEDDSATDEMFIIVSGNVEILKNHREIEISGPTTLKFGTIQERLAVLGPGDFFGEMAMLNEKTRSASARALNQVQTIVLKKDDLFALFERKPKLAVQMLRSISNRLRDTSARPSLDLILPELQKRIAQWDAERRAGTREEVLKREADLPVRREEEKVTKKQPSAPESGRARAEKKSVQPVKACADCNRAARPDAKFCDLCGKRL